MSAKILLVGINAKFIHTNLAIRTLKANVGECQDMVMLAEYTINHQRAEILRGIYEKQPCAIGFSCYLWNIEYVLSIASDLKKIMPEVSIFAGGPEVSYHPEEVLEQYPFFDFIIVGEGERTFYEYAKCLQKTEAVSAADYKKIKGIVYRDGTDYRRTDPRLPMSMDDLVFPYSDLRGLENRILYYESIRGCPFSCSYCLSSIEKRVRIKSPEKTEQELDFFLANRVPQVKFVDRTFNCDREYAYRIWKYIGEHDNGITNFHFEIAGDLLREKDFDLLAKFRPGLVQFEIGVQSTNPDTIAAIRRTMKLDVLRNNIDKVRANRNIHQHLDLIAGLPYENYESFYHSFNEVYAMKPDQLQLGFLKVLTGSYMYEEREKHQIQYSSQPPYEVLSTKWLSYDDILSLKQVEDMVEVYYNSFQFTASMTYLEKFFATPFDMYRELGNYYKEKQLFARKHSRIQRYEILWEFAEQYVSEKEIFRQIVTYDLYLRDYVKNPPAFVKLREEEVKNRVRTFLDKECETPHYLTGYEGYVTKQLYHMVYMDVFTVDMTTFKQTTPYYLLFDYQKRNPLDHSAKVIKILPV